MTKTYTIYILGDGGSAVNRAGRERYEAVNNGVFTNESEARKAAVKLGKICARDSEDGVCCVAIVVSADKDRIPNVLTVAIVTRGRKAVDWA